MEAPPVSRRERYAAAYEAATAGAAPAGEEPVAAVDEDIDPEALQAALEAEEIESGTKAAPHAEKIPPATTAGAQGAPPAASEAGTTAGVAASPAPAAPTVPAAPAVTADPFAEYFAPYVTATAPPVAAVAVAPATPAPSTDPREIAIAAAEAATRAAAATFPRPPEPEKSEEQQEYDRNRAAVEAIADQRAQEKLKPILEELQQMRLDAANTARRVVLEETPVLRVLPRGKFEADFQEQLDEALIAESAMVATREKRPRILSADEVRTVGRRVTDRYMRGLAHFRAPAPSAAASAAVSAPAASPVAPPPVATPPIPAPPPVASGANPAISIRPANGAGRPPRESRAERLARYARRLG